MLSIYQNIKKQRILLDLSQERLAVLTGYTDRSSISKIEKGEVDLTLSKVEAFAKALHVSPADLMGWDEPEDSEINSIFPQLDERDQEAVLSMARSLLQADRYQQKKDGSHSA